MRGPLTVRIAHLEDKYAALMGMHGPQYPIVALYIVTNDFGHRVSMQRPPQLVMGC